MKSRFLFRSILTIGLTLMITSSLAMASTSPKLTTTIVKEIPLQNAVSSIIYDPINGDIYSVSNVISVFHGTREVASIPIQQGSQQDKIVVNPVNGDVYYVGMDRVVVIHGTQLLQGIDWHSQNYSSKSNIEPVAITIDPKTGDVYVANDTDGKINNRSDVEVFDKNGEYIKTISLKNPVQVYGMAYDSHNHQLYVVDWNYNLHKNGIDVFNSRKYIQRINLPYKVNVFGGFTGHIIYDYDTGLIYAEELTPPEDKNSPYFTGKLAIIRNTTIMHEIEIAPQSIGEWGQMSFDSKSNKIYMNFGASNVIQAIHNFSLSSFPVSIPEHNSGIGAVTIDNKTNQVYVFVTNVLGGGNYLDVISMSH